MKEIEIGAIIATIIAIGLSVDGQISWWIPVLFALQSIKINFK